MQKALVKSLASPGEAWRTPFSNPAEPLSISLVSTELYRLLAWLGTMQFLMLAAGLARCKGDQGSCTFHSYAEEEMSAGIIFIIIGSIIWSLGSYHLNTTLETQCFLMHACNNNTLQQSSNSVLFPSHEAWNQKMGDRNRERFEKSR